MRSLVAAAIVVALLGLAVNAQANGVYAMNERLLRPFKEGRIPLTGFVNAHHDKTLGADKLRRLLDLWLDAGADLGNHTYSHLDINNVPLAEYTANVALGEPILRAALAARGKPLRYFRHPYLHAGPTVESKAGLQRFLDDAGYRVAPLHGVGGRVLRASFSGSGWAAAASPGSTAGR